MDFNLDSLDNLELTEDVQLVTKVKMPSKLPESADLRLFSNGAVYPSKAFADANSLEFVKRTISDAGVVVNGNGLDIFSSKDWGLLKGKLDQEILLVSVSPKSAPRVDMWSTAKYSKETQEPVSSIFTQGSNVFSKNQFINIVADTYGIDWSTTEYVDFKVADKAITTTNGVYLIPKTVAAGKNKGAATYVRRDSIIVNPLLIEFVKTKDKPKVVATKELLEVAPVVEPIVDILEEFSSKAEPVPMYDIDPSADTVEIHEQKPIEDVSPEPEEPKVDKFDLGDDWANAFSSME